MIVLDAPLASLRADAGDRFDGKRHLYPNGRPITRLRLVGKQEGRWYYAAADDTTATLPSLPVKTVGVAIGGKLGGRRV